MSPRRHWFILLIGLLVAAMPGQLAAQDGPPGGGAALAGTGFTYQGQLTSGGSPVSGTCDFQFSLWDALSSGTQLGSTETLSSVTVTGGRFTVVVNAGNDFQERAFDGSARWLAIAVRCPAGGGGYTSLTPRQALTAAPLAFALPGLRTEFSGLGSPNVVGGHISNAVTEGRVGATIAGGGANGAANSVTANYGTVGGGGTNTVTGAYGTVGGGDFNLADSSFATVGGGQGNTALGQWTTVGGGELNNASGLNATVGGGLNNTSSDHWATVGGGQNNTASDSYAAVGGGYSNTASGSNATVGGGDGNTASGDAATVPGGLLNTASGNYSFAAGYGALAQHNGSFVWADGTGQVLPSTAVNQFLVRASGGVTMYTDSGATTGVRVFPGSGSWTSVSDRNAKTNFAPVDGVAILNTLAGIPIETWNFNTQDESIRHMGPMAQDFYAAFGLGETDTGISTVDADGVALAAIQGLYSVVQEKDAALEAQSATLDAQSARIAALEGSNADLAVRVAALETGAGPDAPTARTAQLAVVLVVGLLAGAATGAGAYALGAKALRR